MDHHMHHLPHDHGVHGMLLFGEDVLYLSHLPMFMSIHDHQVILEVTLAGAAPSPAGGDQDDVQAIYRADRRDSGERVYTLVPEPFSLLRLGAEGADALRSFRGTVHRGHFEKPGNQAILSDVTVNVVTVIHFRQFDPNAQALPNLQYLLFGRSHELYMAHWITKPPDFDQIVRVASVRQDFPEEVLQRGVQMTFPAHANTIGQRLRGGEQATAQGGVILETAAELYLEEGELAENVTFETTDEEHAAGFV